MADGTGIEWTDATWNPTAGCDYVSPGCKNCYAAKLAGRLARMGQAKYAGTTRRVTAGGRGLDVWNGVLNTSPETLEKPLRWKTGRRIFVNSMSDLFHAEVPFEFIDRVFAVMALTPQHTYQVLTKRPERMRDYILGVGQSSRDPASAVRGAALAEWVRGALGGSAVQRLIEASDAGWWEWRHMPNVWLGTSVEDQKRADERIPHLLRTPAAIRFLSCEPLLGPVSLHAWMGHWIGTDFVDAPPTRVGGREIQNRIRVPKLHWIIVGGESGPGARPMHPDWARSLRDQCQAAGVPFHFKQAGEWAWSSDELNFSEGEEWARSLGCAGEQIQQHVSGHTAARVGKKRAGRLLDGRTWDEMPEARP